MSAHLPGAPRRDKTVRTLAGDGDPKSARSREQLQAGILQLLEQKGAQRKWQLREALHETEARIYDELRELRTRKLVTRIGGPRRAAWDLATRHQDAEDAKRRWNRSTAADFSAFQIALPKPKPTKESWWIGLDRQQLEEVADKRRRHLPETSTIPDVKVTRVTIAPVEI